MFNPDMAADVLTPLIKAGIELLSHALAHARRMLGKRKYEQLLSTTIAELLKAVVTESKREKKARKPGKAKKKSLVAKTRKVA